VDHAMTLLVDGGWVVGHGGMGMFVAQYPPR
jgi:hypothetical protein